MMKHLIIILLNHFKRTGNRETTQDRLWKRDKKIALNTKKKEKLS